MEELRRGESLIQIREEQPMKVLTNPRMILTLVCHHH
jgi:hypothetical protein